MKRDKISVPPQLSCINIDVKADQLDELIELVRSYVLESMVDYAGSTTNQRTINSVISDIQGRIDYLMAVDYEPYIPPKFLVDENGYLVVSNEEHSS